MRQVRITLAMLIVFLFTGCSALVTQVERDECIFGASVAGASLGSTASPIGGAGGMLGGGLLGLLLCSDAQLEVISDVTDDSTSAVEPDISGNFIIPDDDGDGVLNHQDACPRTAAGVQVEANGCVKDNDCDGIPYYLDKCPETPLGMPVDEYGCSRQLVGTLRGVHFEFDSAKLTAEATSILDGVIDKISAYPNQDIMIEGHADSTGTDRYNMGLSLRRAKSVVDYLSSHSNIPSSRLHVVGRGERAPVTSNDTSTGRKQNRRVEIFVK